jgi:hypothetical protein
MKTELIILEATDPEGSPPAERLREVGIDGHRLRRFLGQPALLAAIGDNGVVFTQGVEGDPAVLVSIALHESPQTEYVGLIRTLDRARLMLTEGNRALH